MKSIVTFIVLISGLFFFHCKKDFSRQPVVTTGDFDLAMAIAHGTLVDPGTREITNHGFCWDSFKKARSQKYECKFEVRRKREEEKLLTSLLFNPRPVVKKFSAPV